MNDRAAPAASPTIPPPPRRWLIRRVLPATLLAAVVALLVFAARDSLRPRIAVEAVPVALRSIEVEGAASSGSSIVVAPGWIEADPSSHRIVALADGVVEEVLVLEGETVAVGQPVATLVDDDARIALERAGAEFARRQALQQEAIARLEAAKIDRETLVAPQRRDAIARAESARLEAAASAAESLAEAADSRRRELADELARLEALAARGGASEGAVSRLRIRLATSAAESEAGRRQVEAARAAARSAEAERTAAARDLELLVAEDLAVASAGAMAEAAAAEVRLAAAARDEAQLRFDRMTVRSPIAGVVVERLAVPGMRLGNDSAAIAETYDPQRLQVRVDVPLAEVARIGVGQPAEITLDLLPDRVFKGEVTRLVHRADLAKNTVPVKVRLIDPDPRLKPDMLARVRFMPSSGDSATRRIATRVFAPEASLRENGPGSASVLAVTGLVGGRGVAVSRTVTLGPTRLEGWREVTDGLRAGEWIVLGESARDGDLVEVAEPARVARSKEDSP